MPQARSELIRPGLPLWAAAFVGLACIAMIVISAWHQWLARDNDLQNAEVDMANLARSLTQHADDTFNLAETIITILAKRIETDRRPGTIEKIHQLLQLPHDRPLVRVAVFDETGRWLATSEKLDMASRNNSDREYFQHHMNSSSRDIHIGAPVMNRSSGQWTVPVSRRVDHENGSFDGVVVATVDIAYFVDYYRKFDIGQTGAISLVNSDGILLARSVDNAVGRNLSAMPIFSQGHNGPPEGTLVR